ncbi:hypothetical protein ZIOFF_066887 [Zingiber officinale]|uniref:Uncharacterized protein n=1 Tax=Zingiber officinale TaxID=94328 RepID=A0A8J5EZG2_ZINOF|nr:hypothetical protein ZIOFF_066887 [Zingiber officinale]
MLHGDDRTVHLSLDQQIGSVKRFFLKKERGIFEPTLFCDQVLHLRRKISTSMDSLVPPLNCPPITWLEWWLLSMYASLLSSLDFAALSFTCLKEEEEEEEEGGGGKNKNNLSSAAMGSATVLASLCNGGAASASAASRSGTKDPPQNLASGGESRLEMSAASQIKSPPCTRLFIPSDLSQERYVVREKKGSRKRRRGLKAMSMESDSE